MGDAPYLLTIMGDALFLHPFLVNYTIDIRGFTGLETPNELHNRGALTDAHAHAALIILIAVKRDQYSLLSRQLK